MTTAEGAVPFEDFRLGEPVEFPAPSPEDMAELRRLLPPVSPSSQGGAGCAA